MTEPTNVLPGEPGDERWHPWRFCGKSFVLSDNYGDRVLPCEREKGHTKVCAAGAWWREKWEKETIEYITTLEAALTAMTRERDEALAREEEEGRRIKFYHARAEKAEAECDAALERERALVVWRHGLTRRIYAGNGRNQIVHSGQPFWHYADELCNASEPAEWCDWLAANPLPTKPSQPQ